MMSSRQDMQTRGRRSSTGAPSLSVPLQELSQVRLQEVALTLAVVEAPLADAISILRHEAFDMTAVRCDVLISILQHTQQIVGGCLDDLMAPDLGLRPYAVILKLSGLHRQLVEALVLAKNVRGLCLRHRLATHDFTGAYVSLRVAFRSIIQEHRTLLTWLARGSGVPEPVTPLVGERHARSPHKRVVTRHHASPVAMPVGTLVGHSVLSQYSVSTQ